MRDIIGVESEGIMVIIGIICGLAVVAFFRNPDRVHKAERKREASEAREIRAAINKSQHQRNYHPCGELVKDQTSPWNPSGMLPPYTMFGVPRRHYN